jgi:antitoxin component YwqK of YwqJK toxin-antitoxin module
MSLFKLFGQQKENDPYWEFHENKHFRPKINKGDFFKLTGSDFVSMLFEPITKFIEDKEHEIERAGSLSYGQKALYFWWHLDAEVTNGGFVQFYYNGYGPYVPTIIKSLKHIGDHEMADLIQRAEDIYQQNRRLMDKAQQSNLFGSDLYEQMHELAGLDDEYYSLNEETISIVEKYIRKHTSEICVDEHGNEIDMKFSGQCETFYANGQLKEQFILEKGKISAEFKSYYENGAIKEVVQYAKGGETGEREEFYENGKSKLIVTRMADKNQLRLQSFYENGNQQQLEHRTVTDDMRTGEYKEWYSNGQLKESGTYLSAYERTGEWLEFYENGTKKLEAEFKNGDFLLYNHWNEKGEQILINGTGKYIHEYSMFDNIERVEREYKNYKRHGQQKTFTNGVLTLYQEMENGIENGYTRTFYKNGKIKEEKLYTNGVAESTKTFVKSENPIGKVSFEFSMTNESLNAKGLPSVDTFASCINEEEIRKIIKTPKSLLEPKHQDIQGSTSLLLAVNEKGDVSDIKFQMAYMSNGDELTEVASKMKFTPAVRDGKNVPSFIHVTANFEVE